MSLHSLTKRTAVQRRKWIITVVLAGVTLLLTWHYTGLVWHIDILGLVFLLLFYPIRHPGWMMEPETNSQRLLIDAEHPAAALSCGQEQAPELEGDMGLGTILGTKVNNFLTGVWNVVHPPDAPVRESDLRLAGRHPCRQPDYHVAPSNTRQDALYLHDQTFRALVENSPDLIVRFDRQLRHLYVNPAVEAFSGIKLEAFTGKTPQELGMPGDEVTAWENMLQTVFESGQERMFESEVTAHGERRVLESRITPEVDESGMVQTILVISRDVTERIEAEQHRLEMVRQQERAQVLERFMREAAHDLITPLTTMKTNLYLMGRTTDDPRMSRRIELLEDETSHIEASINALLKMTRINRETFEFEKTDMNQFIGQWISRWQEKAEQKQIPLIFEPGIDIPAVMLDQYEFQYVIQELMKNAIAHSTAAHPIIVRTSKQADHVCLSIIDHGEGIAPEDIEFIFEPFYRASAREVSKGGIGLGLTITKLIVQAHNGTITVESTPDEGSTFCVILPIERKSQ